MGRRGEIGRRGFCRAAVTLVGAAALAGAAGARAAGMGAQQVGLGPGASLGGKRVFPADNPWNQDISELPADPNSDALIRSIGLDKHLHPDFGTIYQGAPVGIPYVVVPGTQPKVPVRFQYADESDPGPYPIPPDAPIEGGPQSERATAMFWSSTAIAGSSTSCSPPTPRAKAGVRQGGRFST
jgi:hypothetical protein